MNTPLPPLPEYGLQLPAIVREQLDRSYKFSLWKQGEDYVAALEFMNIVKIQGEGGTPLSAVEQLEVSLLRIESLGAKL